MKQLSIKEISTEKLEKMKKNDKYVWKRTEMKRVNSAGMGLRFIPLYKERFYFQCHRCNARFTLAWRGRCENCGSYDSYKCGYNEDWGIACSTCKAGFSTWHCSKCGTENSASTTLYMQEKERGGRFIATAVYGSDTALDVLLLRIFGDTVLLSSITGKLFVKTYYLISPPVAKNYCIEMIHPQTRSIIFIQPIVVIIADHD
jgi:hypothetical protein